MKIKIIALTLTLAALLCACAAAPQAALPSVAPASEPAASESVTIEPQTEAPAAELPADLPETPAAEPFDIDVYADVFEQYRQAVEEKWGPDQLMAQDMSLMLLDCYGDAHIGYTYLDLDGNGTEEFLVALTDAFTDEYYGKLVLGVYSVDADGNAVQVFSSGDRYRYYFAGDNRFAFLGANAASDSVETTMELCGSELIDLSFATDPAAYVQLPLVLFW